jgi:hypothetical protein
MKTKGDSIYIKSHPETSRDGGYQVNLEISCYGTDESQSKEAVQKELEIFRKKFMKS